MTYRNAYGRFAVRPTPNNVPARKPIKDADRLVDAKVLLAQRFGFDPVK